MKKNALPWITFYEEQARIAGRLRGIRKAKRISQRRLSEMSDVAYASIRRFEKIGEISFSSFVKIAMALGLTDDLESLFQVEEHYDSIEEVIRDQQN